MKRIITATILLVASYYLIFWSRPLLFLAAALLVGCLCYREYATLVAAHGIASPGLLGLIGGLSLLIFPHYTLIAATVISLTAFAAALRLSDLKLVVTYAACVVFGAFYTFAPWRFAVDLRERSTHLLFFALALNWAGDSIAFYVGRRFGKHRLAPVVSPKKSWEGSAASVAGSIGFGVLYLRHFVPNLAIWQIVLLASAGNIAGQIGDLAESALKRGAGVKDSSNLLPGHGGMLDRLDSSLFALPTIYALLQILKT